jgi:glycosyltransferase involved in cell wall biosynthesis
MRISVALAAYNGALYIRQQLDSILDNLSAEDEIVISDDGSTDGTIGIIEEYRKRDGRIRLLKGPGEGVIANFEHAISECRGTYIFLADQDDLWMPDKTAKVMTAFSDPKVHLVIHDAKVMNADLSETLMESFFTYRGSKPGVWVNLLKNRYMGCCMAFRRELIPKILPIPRDIPMHDQWIGLVCDHFYGNSVFLKEVLLYYRRHADAVSDFEHNSFAVMLHNRLHLYFCFRKRIRLIERETEHGDKDGKA